MLSQRKWTALFLWGTREIIYNIQVVVNIGKQSYQETISTYKLGIPQTVILRSLKTTCSFPVDMGQIKGTFNWDYTTLNRNWPGYHMILAPSSVHLKDSSSFLQ